MKKGLIFIFVLVVAFAGLYLFKDQIFKVEKEPIGIVVENGQIEQWQKEAEEINGKAKNGEFLFKVAQAATTGPRFVSGKLEPENVLPGMTQIMEIKLTDSSGIVSVQADIQHDQGWDKVDLKLTEGNEFEGTWTGEWLVHSTHDTFYKTIFTATNKEGQKDILTLAWKDSCPIGRATIPAENAVLLNYPAGPGSSCSVSEGAVGTMDGEIKITGQVILSRTGSQSGYLVFGNKVTFTSGGKILLSGGVLIREGNQTWTPGGQFYGRKAAICLPDRDNDGYWDKNALAGEFYFGTSTECQTDPRYKKITDLTNRGDCDDNNSSVIPGACHPSLIGQRCNSNFSGNWIGYCGDGQAICGETCEIGETLGTISCPSVGVRTCVTGLCNYGGNCSEVSGCGGFTSCGAGCCPAAYPYCVINRCCQYAPDPQIGYYCINPLTPSPPANCPLGASCCSVPPFPNTCCPDYTTCIDGVCYGTSWTDCVPGTPARIESNFRIAAITNACDLCTPGSSQGCIYFSPMPRTCNSSCSGWQPCLGLPSPPTHFTLTVTKSGTGSGTVSSNPAGISCGATCSANFSNGSTVNLYAAPDSNSYFEGWSGPCSGRGACTVLMVANKTVGASFSPCISNGSNCMIVKPYQCCSGYCSPATSTCQKFIQE